jgi:hypothetical protein
VIVWPIAAVAEWGEQRRRDLQIPSEVFLTSAQMRNGEVAPVCPTSVNLTAGELQSAEVTAAVVRQDEAPVIRGTDEVRGRSHL